MQRRAVRHGMAVRRGIVIAALAVCLGVAGAPPAAAAEPGFIEQSVQWLSGLLADSLREALDLLDQGAGLDPNGKPPVVILEPPPVLEIR